MNDAHLIRGKNLFLFALEGTLFQGDRLSPDAIALLRRIRETGGRYLFLTNNSSLGIDDYIRTMRKLGILSRREDYLTSAQATAWYLGRNHPDLALYVCGTVSLKRELEGAGLTVTEDPDRAQCVVLGYDTELTYGKLRDVCRLLQTRDIPYLAANPDDRCPTDFGFVPDCGSIAQMIARAAGKHPKFLGKPDPLMARLAMERAGVSPERTCLVGDRPDTDIRCGRAAGITTVLLTGGAPAPEGPDRPDLCLRDAADLLRLLSQ